VHVYHLYQRISEYFGFDGAGRSENVLCGFFGVMFGNMINVTIKDDAKITFRICWGD